MDPSTLLPAVSKIVAAAARAAVSAIQRKALTSAQVKKLSEQVVSDIDVGVVRDALLKSSEADLDAVERFLHSPEFRNMVIRTTVADFTGSLEQDLPRTREWLRDSVRGSGFQDEFQLVYAVDCLLGLIKQASNSANSELTTQIAGKARSAVFASAVNDATVAVRAGGFAQNLRDIVQLNSKCIAARTVAASLYRKFTVANVTRVEAVAYEKLYVRPDLRIGEDSERLTLGTLFDRGLKVVLLGNPGAGKSTLAALLANKLAGDEIADMEGHLPILFAVRDHAQSVTGSRTSLVGVILEICRAKYQVEFTTEEMEYLLTSGRAVIIIDGLDELGESYKRKLLAESVDAFSVRYPLTKVAVTSRRVGYLDAPLDPDIFCKSEVEPFNDTEVREYCSKWFAIDGRTFNVSHEERVESFMQDSENSNDLRTNPLMLSLLCCLHTRDGSIPDTRPEVYEACARLLVETWDKNRGLTPALLYLSDVRPLLEKLAWKIFTDQRQRQWIPRQEIVDYLSATIARKYARLEEAVMTAESFVNHCSGRAWVLTEVGSEALRPVYGFVHRTFLEYFAARRLVAENISPLELWEVLKGKIGTGRWDNVAELAVQIYANTVDNGGDRVLRLLLGGIAVGSPSASAVGLIRFAVRVLPFASPDIGTIARVCRAAMDLVPLVDFEESRFAQTEQQPTKPLLDLLDHSSPALASQIAGAIDESISELTSSNEDYRYGILVLHILRYCRNKAAPTAIQRNVAHQLEARLEDEKVHEAQRLLTYPAVEDVRRFGVPAALYRTYTALSGRSIGPAAASILRDFAIGMPSGTKKSIAACASFYPELFDYFRRSHSWTFEYQNDSWRDFLPSINASRLAALPSRSRNAILLLLLPALREGRHHLFVPPKSARTDPWQPNPVSGSSGTPSIGDFLKEVRPDIDVERIIRRRLEIFAD